MRFRARVRLVSIGPCCYLRSASHLSLAFFSDLIPAIQAGEVDVHETLKETGRGTSGRQWLRSSLVVV